MGKRLAEIKRRFSPGTLCPSRACRRDVFLIAYAAADDPEIAAQPAMQRFAIWLHVATGIALVGCLYSLYKIR
jgi:hypothetical protein